MSTTKKIGILTSGGDCAGLNAVIRAVVNSASRLGWEVYGIKNGTDGLTEKPLAYEILTVHNFSDTPWPRISGSYLGSLNKGVKMESLEEVSKRFGEGVKTLGLDAIVVVGGDGSMNIVSNYCKNAGVKMVGIPKTIDNDTPITEFSVGFNSACQVCTSAIDSLDATARSHSRALILEVMGRDAGHLAMHSAAPTSAWFPKFLTRLIRLSKSSRKSKLPAAAMQFWSYPKASKPKTANILPAPKTLSAKTFTAASAST